MEIRYLKIEDFYELRNLLDGVFSRKSDRETSFEKLFPRFFTEPNEYVTSSHLGAFIDGRLAGTAALYPLDYIIGNEHIKLVGNGNIAVHEDFRGQGVMSSLLKVANDELDRIGDVGYLHGNPIRYGRFGYFGKGTQYKLTFGIGNRNDYKFLPLEEKDSEFLLQNVDFRSDHIVRSAADLIPALRSNSREALGVYDKNDTLIGYVSIKDDFIEEFAFIEKNEREVFEALGKEKGKNIHVRFSGYDKKTIARLEENCTIEKSQPAMFRIVNNQRLENVIRKLGLGMDDLYAPYLT